MVRIRGGSLKWMKRGAIFFVVLGIIFIIDTFLTDGYLLGSSLIGSILFVLGVSAVNSFDNATQKEIDSCKDPVEKFEKETSQEGCYIIPLWGGVSFLTVVFFFHVWLQ